MGGPLFVSILEGRRGFSSLTSLKLFVALNSVVDGGAAAAVLLFVAPPPVGSNGFDPDAAVGLNVVGGAFEESDIRRFGGVESGFVLLAGPLFSLGGMPEEPIPEELGLKVVLGGVNPPLASLDFEAKSLLGKLDGGFVSGGPVAGALADGGVVEGGDEAVFAVDLILFFESSNILSDAGRTTEPSIGSCFAGFV